MSFSALENTLRTRLKEIFDLMRRMRELIAELEDAQYPGAPHAASHSNGGPDQVDVTDLGGFPGGGTTFLRDDGTFAAAGAGTPSATVEDLDGTGDAGVSTDYSRGDHKHADTNRPTDDEKAALVGTSGSPGAGNPYVTDADSRLTDDRDPNPHAISHGNGGGDEIDVGGLSGVLADPQTVATDVAGALDGNGATGTPLAVRVDGVTVIINGSNELEAVGVGGGSPGAVLSGTHYPIKFTVDGGGDVIATGVKRYTARISPDGGGSLRETHLHSEQTTNLDIDVRKNGASITDGNLVTLSGGTDASDTSLADWDDVTIAEDDILTIDVDVNSASEFFELTLITERT